MTMRTRTKFLLAGIAGITVLIACFASFLDSTGGGVVRERFSSYSEAMDKGALIHGMVPAFLPNSATEITAERNIDLDTLTVEFAFGSDFDSFLFRQKRDNHPLPTNILAQTSFSNSDSNRL